MKRIRPLSSEQDHEDFGYAIYRRARLHFGLDHVGPPIETPSDVMLNESYPFREGSGEHNPYYGPEPAHTNQPYVSAVPHRLVGRERLDQPTQFAPVHPIGATAVIPNVHRK